MAPKKTSPPSKKLKASFAGWRSAGTAFYVTTNERDPKFFDPASGKLFFLSDEDSEFARLKTDELATGAAKEHEKARCELFQEQSTYGVLCQRRPLAQ